MKNEVDPDDISNELVTAFLGIPVWNSVDTKRYREVQLGLAAAITMWARERTLGEIRAYAAVPLDKPPAWAHELMQVQPHVHEWDVIAVRSGADGPATGLLGSLTAMVTYVLSRCVTCREVKSDTLSGSWTEAEIRGREPGAERGSQP